MQIPATTILPYTISVVSFLNTLYCESEYYDKNEVNETILLSLCKLRIIY